MIAEQEENIDWHTEALGVIKDVKDHVKTILISEKLITGSIFFIVCEKLFQSLSFKMLEFTSTSKHWKAKS